MSNPHADRHLDYLRRRGKLVTLTLSDDEIARQMIRTSGLTICSECGKNHYDHPLIENLLYDGMPWLHYICDGTIAKL